ncbi:hypothetical protein UJ101_01066 [Flavobacteriaceae bacterium UJ101]|nr:hypothetical protein UJ101_01066 [Flavobacteriaceae bacterium UJ101]
MNPNELEHIDLRSEEVQEVLSNPPRWIVRWGITIIFLSIILILMVSWMVKYPDFISTTIKITTNTPIEKIEAQTGGRIVKFLVEDQQKVNRNEILAVIENTANFNDILNLREVIDSFNQNYTNFKFPIEKIQHLNLGELEQDYALFEKAYSDYTLHKKLKPYSIESLASEQTLLELNTQSRVLKSQQELERKELEVRKKDYNRTKSLYEEGVISQVDLESKELDYLQAKRNYENTKIQLSQLHSSKVTAQKGIQSSTIHNTQDNTRFLKEVILSYEQLKRSLKQWEHIYLIKASISGKASFQQFWGENQFVKVGDNVISILPLDSEIVGKITTKANKTGKIKPNQKVLIKLDNYPYQEFGMVEGYVKTMSLTPDKQGNYYIEVTLPNKLHTTYNKDLYFQQEMQGTADIITEDLRLIERIFYQFRDLFKYN